MDFEWAPGHLGGKVRVCRTCDKRLERSEKSETTWDGQPSNEVVLGGITLRYEERADGIYVVWERDFPDDTFGSRRLLPEEVTDTVRAIVREV